jgi:hypothetical protein
VVELGYVDHKPFLDDWGPSIKKAFGTLEPFIKERRKQHDNDRYFDNFERLADSVISWENSRLLPWWRRRRAYSHEKQQLARLRAAKAAESDSSLPPVRSEAQNRDPTIDH